jgi:hypothetical protein
MEWITTGNKIMGKNRMMGMAFTSMANYLTKLEDSPEDWHLAPVRGHTRIHKLFPFYPADLQHWRLSGSIQYPKSSTLI